MLKKADMRNYRVYEATSESAREPAGEANQ
jgi:hypothetical protein